MDVKEFYKEISGDYEGVLSRFPSESFAEKFIIRFLDDSSFDDLCENFEKKNYREAFRAAHNLKGLGLNLGFTQLGKSGSDMADVLRNEELKSADIAEAKRLFQKVREDYNEVIVAIKKFKV